MASIKNLKDKAVDRVAAIDKEDLKDKVRKAAVTVGDKAGDIKDAAMDKKADIEEKLSELDRMLESTVTEYNDAYTLMNDKGVQLFIERNRAVDTIGFVESLVSSIANKPKSFDADFEEIKTNRDSFLNACDFGERELQAARQAVGGAGAGLAAGASVAFMAPTAAMWVATTFGTASTGTAISALSGAAAQSAALAWLGGGTVAAGGGGVAAGNALLAMAGPVGWSIAGATLLTSIVLFAKKRGKLNKKKNDEIESVKKNIVKVRKVDAQIKELLSQTESLRSGVNGSYAKCLELTGKDYKEMDADQRSSLGALVNQTKALSALFEKTIS